MPRFQHQLAPETASAAALIAQRQRLGAELNEARAELKKHSLSVLRWNGVPLLITIVACVGYRSVPIGVAGLLLIIAWSLISGLVFKSGPAGLLRYWTDVRQRQRELQNWDDTIEEIAQGNI